MGDIAIRFREMLDSELKVLVANVRTQHDEVGMLGHHDFFHAVRVASMAYHIGCSDFDDRIGFLSAIAGLCHNADRLIQFRDHLAPDGVLSASQKKELGEILEGCISDVRDLLEPEREVIYQAVWVHSEPHADHHHPVTTVLIDADRVVNLGADVLLRQGQYFTNMMTVNPNGLFNDPQASFKAAGSVLASLRFVMEWGDPNSPFCVKLPTARRLVEPRVAFLRSFVETVEAQLHDEGMDPPPRILADWNPKY